MTAATEDLLRLLAGLLAVLLLASAVGLGLARRAGPQGPSLVVENLNARIRAWWVMIAVMGVALALGPPGAILLFALLSAAALREFLALLDVPPADRRMLALTFGLVVPVQYALVWTDWYGLYSIFIPVYAFLLLPIPALLAGETERFLARMAEVQWALMICVFCVSHVPALLMLDIPGYEGRNVLLIAFLVVVVQGSDVLQYVWGKLAGRRPIAPRLSPSKTVEGFAGGAASATLLGAGLWWMTPFTPLQAGAMALAVVLMGFLGGLVMSAIKRDRKVKDWGRLIAGHGGFLDRLDSVIFSAPIFYHLTRYWWSTT